jgi:integrase
MKGSVVKRCQCAPLYDSRHRRIACKIKHGSWSYVADAGRDPATGKRRQVKQGGFATKVEAEAALAKLIDQSSKGLVSHDDRLHLGVFLDQWLAGKVANGLRPTTERSYRQHIQDYIKPTIGHVRLRDLRGTHVEAVLAAVQQPRPGRRPVQPATVRRVHATLRSALASAKKRRLVSFNAAHDVELPSAPRPKVRPWEPEELGAFLDAVATDRLGVFLDLKAGTGLRRGEALGIRWADLDLVRGKLRPRQQVTQMPGLNPCPQCGGEHRGLILTPTTKTDAGDERAVDLDSLTIGLLLEHRLRQDAGRAAWGSAYVDHGLVFARENGEPLSPNAVSGHFQTLVSKSGQRRVRLHDLRHGRASLLLAAGVDIALVSKMLGHSTLTITADTYSHLLEGVGRQAAERATALVPRNRATAGLRDQSVTNHGLEQAS